MVISSNLSPNKKIHSTSGIEYTIKGLIAEGGQGQIYKVTSNGRDWVLKWYFNKEIANEQEQFLENIISRGPPTNKFIWPLEIVTDPYIPNFGYIMPYVDSSFKKPTLWLSREIHVNFYNLLTVGIELANSFHKLHSDGWCYKDISLGNLLINPNNGDIRIIDNDNVRVDKQSHWRGGTPGYIAPEIQSSNEVSSADTDRYSLAVLLFQIFFSHHPLDGKNGSKFPFFDEEAENYLYYKHPVFIFDPNNDENRPDPNVSKNPDIFWNIYPQILKDMFIKSFTNGLTDPKNGRIYESAWRENLIQLRDSIVYCQKCMSENFCDIDLKEKDAQYPLICWKCGSKVTLPPVIKIGKHTVILHRETKLYLHHIDGVSFKFDVPIAEMVQNPSKPGVWGLKNLTADKWIVTKPDGSTSDVVHNRSVVLTEGLVIDFGVNKGKISR